MALAARSKVQDVVLLSSSKCCLLYMVTLVYLNLQCMGSKDTDEQM